MDHYSSIKLILLASFQIDLKLGYISSVTRFFQQCVQCAVFLLCSNNSSSFNYRGFYLSKQKEEEAVKTQQCKRAINLWLAPANGLVTAVISLNSRLHGLGAPNYRALDAIDDVWEYFKSFKKCPSRSWIFLIMYILLYRCK